MTAYVKSFYKYRFLLSELASRDIKIKYRRSVLGLLWTVLNPLMMMTILTVVFSHVFRMGIEHFPVYLLCGQLVFNFFSESTNGAMNSILAGSALIKKVYIPKYVFPLAKVLSTSVNLLASFIAMLIVALVTNVQIKPTIVFIIVPFICLIVFCIGVGLILSAVAVFFRDMIYLYSVLTMMMMYLTPMIYSMDILPNLVWLVVKMNPLTSYMEYIRQIVLYGSMPTFVMNYSCVGWSIIAILLGVWVFVKNQNKFILHI